MNVASLENSKRLCSIEECVRKHEAKGYCALHYKRFKHHGKPLERYPARTHGRTKTPEYYAWSAMKQRCLNSKNPQYRWYGARGVKVCDRWLKFDNFLADVGLRPSPELELDRINNNGHYEPGNVRWVTHLENMSNTRSAPQYAHSIIN